MTIQEQLKAVIESTVKVLAEDIRQKEFLLDQQSKLIDNLVAENERLKPIRRQVKFVERVRPGKASSWRRSAWLGLRDGILTAPDRLFLAIKTPLLGTIFGAAVVVGSLIAWLVARPLILIVGLCGFLVEKKELDRQ
ncbi:hypothetical protein IVB12_15670 [Bradyrhizobium sp. 179]|uniref:hypothetical protein n=1 Tax=Bradyrhizobium sp. 179 TaxID=2782648 RepID=UPI001FFA0EF9|nr:hypothetical protein [Bradyrhizobium sp. 179]MCK1543354.1 hypothetical protein [Bradyrhizobium sp. 179]